MATYKVTDPVTGKTLRLTGDAPPTEQELEQVFASVRPSAEPARTPDRPQGLATIGDQLRAKAPELGEGIGGMVGGMTRGRVGAAVGGAAGRGYGELIKHATELPGAVVDVARNMVTEPVATMKGALAGMAEGAEDAGLAGVRQGALQMAGEGMAAGATKLGKWLMNRATSRVTSRLAMEFPELSDTLIDNALTVSKGGESKARLLLKLAKDKATRALTTAEQAGATIPAQLTPEIADSFKTALIESAIKSGQIPKAQGAAVSVASARLPKPLAALFSKVDAAVTAGAPIDLTPTQADLLKTFLQKESRALYLNRVAPNGPRAMSQAATELGEYAAQLNTAIDAVAAGYKSANAQAKPLIGAMRGIKQATRPSGNLYQAMVRPAVGAALGGEAGRRQSGAPGAVAGAVLGAAMTSPAGMSREAILLSSPQMQSLLRQMPRATATALAALLSGQEPPTR